MKIRAALNLQPLLLDHLAKSAGPHRLTFFSSSLQKTTGRSAC